MSQSIFDFGKTLKVYKFESFNIFHNWLEQNGFDKQYDFRLASNKKDINVYYCLVSEDINKNLNICCVIKQQVEDNVLDLTTIYNTGCCVGYIRSAYLDDVRNFIKDYMHYDMYKLSEYDLEELGYVKNVKNYADKNIIDIFNIKEDLEVVHFYIDWLYNKRVNVANIKKIYILKGAFNDTNLPQNAKHIHISELEYKQSDFTHFSCFDKDYFPVFAVRKISFNRCKIGEYLNLSFLTKLDVIEFCGADLTEMKDLKVSNSVSTINLSRAKLGYFKFDLKRLGPKFVFDKLPPNYSQM